MTNYTQSPSDPQELWRDIPEYNNLYQASNLGQIRSVDRIVKVTGQNPRRLKSRTLSQAIFGAGYYLVNLSKNNIPKTRLVHRLIMSAFHGPCPDGYEVNHKDGDKSNNRLDNLEYMTPTENAQHGYQIGLTPKGSQRSDAKLNEQAVSEIKRDLANGIKVSDLAKRHKVSWSAINKIRKGKSWRHVN